MMKKILLSILLLAAACTSETASLTDGAAPTYSASVSNQKVNTIAEDSRGAIWLGTFRGLNLYTPPGEYHQYFTSDDTLSIPDNQINHILSSSEGELWVATVNGPAVMEHDGRFRRIPLKDANRNINKLYENRSGDILATNGSILFKYEDGALRPRLRDLAAFNPAESQVDASGRLWIICDGGFSVKAVNTEDFSVSSIPTKHQAYHMTLMGDSELWLSGMGGLSILDTRTMAWKELPKAVSARKDIMGGDVDRLFAVDDKSLLLSVIGKGFYHYYKTTEKVSFQEDPGFPFSIPDAEVCSIFRDSRHNLWFGTTDQGFSISYAIQGEFSTNKFLTSFFKGKTVTSLCPDGDKLWITTYRDGMFLYDRKAGRIEPVDVSNLVSDKNIGYIRCSKVFRDSSGEYWLLFSDKYRTVRCRWNGKVFLPLDTVFSLMPISITEDDGGNIWIGSLSSSVTVYDKASRKAEQIPVFKEDWTFVTDFVRTESGKLIAAGFSQPLAEINTYSRESRLLETSEEVKNATVKRSVLIPNKLFRDSAGEIWMGTVANGLIRGGRDGIATVEGLPCEDVCSIEEDRQGNIWVSTMNGLAKYDRTTGRFVHYFEPDGIGGNQFSDRASCIMDDGTLVFGGTHGITWFNPLDTPAKRTVPLVFQDLEIQNRPTVLQDKITIHSNENAFSISYAALDYSEYGQVRYAYKMEGFNHDWVRTGTSNKAYFANLPAGEYRFRVTIDNNNHSIVPVEASIGVKVLPPWYASWWGILLWILLGAFIIGMGYTYYRHLRRIRLSAARRIQAEREEKKKAQEAREAEKALNKIQMNYFANVAHEFRTPLTMIAGPAQQLSSSPNVKGQDRKLADVIRRNSAWMLSLVNQLLDFNRIGNSKLQMKVAKMDVVQPLKDTADLFSFNAGSKGIELTTSGLEEPFTMWVDADKVQKVVMNLLSNAMKFTPSGGRVHLGFDVISRDAASGLFPLTDADTDGQWACISVSDSGCGIPEGELEKIFERFYQSSDGKKSYGSGIGLYYSRALASFHHGYIKAWNKDDGGALFRLVLPVSAASYSEDERTAETPQLQLHALASEVASPDTDQNGKKHIAVVDDDIDIANYLKILLSPSYKVTLYFDGTSALKGMEEEQPDLVISDVVMPGMDGYELCSSIKGNLDLSHIPVVLVTAKVAVESQVQGLGKGADAYVTKPFQPEYLLALVKSLLENREKLHRQLGEATTAEEIAPDTISPRDAAFMKDLYALMEKELANADLDIVKMAEMMKISRTKFYYKVKGLTGENPSVFFKRYKLNRAAELLREGKLNMSEIAWTTGFNTLSHFSTSFKKQFGVPPSDYKG